MMRRALSALRRGYSYTRQHPQVLFVLTLVVVFPLLFLYTGQQFLEVGRENQERLQKDRIGLMHDVFATLLVSSGFDIAQLQADVQRIAAQNPDITKFRVVTRTDVGYVPVAALDSTVLGVPEPQDTLYRSAAIQGDETLIFEFTAAGERRWQSFRPVEAPDGTTWFIFTENSFAALDALIAAREQRAYLMLGFVYAFIFALAWWHVRLTDYRYLYLEAQAANRTRDLFTNMITHELRAPLTAMRGYASMIEEDAAADYEGRQYATRIRQSAERLLAIVNDLLEVARIQSGKLTVRPESVDVAAVVRAVALELQSSAAARQLNLRTVGVDTRHTLHTDPKRLHQILVNLTSNAIKYTEAGTVELAIAERPNEIEVRVKDSGRGIEADDQQKLFEPFFRVAGVADDVTGTGLGMWITRQLVELLGGEVAVESIKGVGTNVVLTLPKRVQSPQSTSSL